MGRGGRPPDQSKVVVTAAEPPRAPEHDRYIRLETMHPEQIQDALERNSLVFLPLGSIEWLGGCLPVGTAGLIAHALCMAVAREIGGLVMPPLYFAAGGRNANSPWSVLMPDAGMIEPFLVQTASRLAVMEVDRLVLLSGNASTEQADMIDRFAESWNAGGFRPRVIATSVERCPEAKPPDRAGMLSRGVV